MERSESITNLVASVIKVMADVKSIDKSLTVGEGKASYQGVADKDVKKIIGEAMEKHGLAILPIDIQETTQLNEWDESTQYGNKRKQSVFTKVTTTYILVHESGEFITLKGYGHGVDSQDKSAGKATTYALKYALLYMFMVPTGKIDDADSHNQEPQQQVQKEQKQKPVLSTDKFNDAVKFLKSGKTIEQLKGFYQVSQEMEFQLIAASES